MRSTHSIRNESVGHVQGIVSVLPRSDRYRRLIAAQNDRAKGCSVIRWILRNDVLNLVNKKIGSD